jgi:uncharacterized protein YjbI with pentapeptide repeats
MPKCSFKTTLDSGEEWECPLDALLEKEHCYWHTKVEGKAPDSEAQKELREKKILGVYLIRAALHGANLRGANLQKACLWEADLQKANLQEADLREADLMRANLQKADLLWAELQQANLGDTNLQEVNLHEANLQEADLTGANLPGAFLVDANFRETDLWGANLQGANLWGVNLREADLRDSNLQKANLKSAHLQNTYLYSVRFDSETALVDSELFDANLFRSYFDETKSFRYVKLFRIEATGKEINEIIGDALGKKTKVSKKKSRFSLHLKLSVLDLNKISEAAPDVAAEILNKEGLAKYARDGTRIVFFDRASGGLRKNLEDGRRRKDDLIIIDGLSDVIVKDGMIRSEYLYEGSRADQFEASYEVYNNLYNFYVNNGRLDQAAHVHYRRGEAHRKLLREKGGFYWLRSWIFDFFVLRLLTGYGDKIERPIGASATIIAVFAFLFWLTDAIVKNVNGKIVSSGWLDYIYHSITTFTSLGYSNIQPNLAVGPLPQIFVAAESVLGILLMALIIFVVTYQVSR